MISKQVYLCVCVYVCVCVYLHKDVSSGGVCGASAVPIRGRVCEPVCELTQDADAVLLQQQPPEGAVS